MIMDHHLPDPAKGIPGADIVIDPHISSDDFKDYCGAGLVYKLAQLYPLSSSLMDRVVALAAIGTVADVVPLIDENRTIVKRGLKVMQDGKAGKAIDTLIKKCDLFDIDETDIGFKIGPIINAAGRIEDDGAETAFKALALNSVTDNDIDRMIAVNEERKTLSQKQTAQAEYIIAEQCMLSKPCLIVRSDTFDSGIIGIVAGRLSEKYQRPALVFCKDGNIWKGSGRTGGVTSDNKVPDLKTMLDSIADTLAGYGGHPGAAGMSVTENQFSEFAERFTKISSELGIHAPDPIAYDLDINAKDINSYIDELKRFAPFGEGNPKPVFRIENYDLLPRRDCFYRKLGDGSTLKLFGNGNDAVGFGFSQAYEDFGCPKSLILYGTLGINKFNHTVTKQVEIKDLEPAADNIGITDLAAELARQMKGF